MKMALCDALIGKIKLFDSIDFSWLHILLAIKQSQLRSEHRGEIAFPNLQRKIIYM